MISEAFGSPSDRLLVAILVALVLHGLLIFGVRFRLPQAKVVQRNLDVVLVTRPDDHAPEKADYRAVHASKGGSPHRKAPAPPPRSAPMPGRMPVRSVAPPHRSKEPARLTTHEKTEAVPAPSRTLPKLDPAILARQIAALDMGVDRPRRFGGERVTPIRKVRAHRYIAAAYERAWQEKVERIGNLNYPDEARRKGLSGRLLISVWVAKDGSVRKIKIHRSSGHRVLDDAAIRIIRLAAPFAPFPKELARQTDVLVITRTWNFYNEAGLAMGH